MLRGSVAAEQQGCRAARLWGSEAAELRDCRPSELRSSEALDGGREEGTGLDGLRSGVSE